MTVSRSPEARPGPAETSAFPAQAPTTEAEWARWAAALAPLALPVASSTIVVAPHPDDESLAAGGLISGLVAAGGRVRVVTVTGGEGSHRGHPGLVDLRRDEQGRALAALGVTEPAIRLDLPDGSVHLHRFELATALEAALHDVDLVVAPWWSDGHTDHDACGRVAHEVVAGSGARLLAFPVWAWQWATPDDLDGLALQRLDLARSQRAAKAAAVACYPSQTTDALGPPILSPAAMARFTRPFEVFADAG